jgi:hypothetical protein
MGGNALSNLNRTARHIALSFGIFGVIAVGLGARASHPPLFIFIYPQKQFAVGTIPLNASTSLTFTLNAVGVGNANVAFTDTLPAGLVVANPNGLTASCGGTVTAAPGSSTISLSGLDMGGSPYPAFCQYTVNVTGTTAGVKDNSYTVTWDQGASSGGPATASVTVIRAATIGKTVLARLSITVERFDSTLHLHPSKTTITRPTP